MSIPVYGGKGQFSPTTKQIKNKHFNHLTQSQVLKTLNNRGFENILGKEENVDTQQFLFPQCLLHKDRNHHFSYI